MAIRTDRATAPARDRGEVPITIPALSSLLGDLVHEGVRFCSWKSNDHLREGLAGSTDLDLLVDREQVDRFREVIGRHRLKRLVAPSASSFPGMEHYLGLDRADGRLFHLHVHYQLVLGERHVKNHRIPLERRFLRSTRLLEGVPAPAPEVELSILAVRALLKYRARDLVKDVLKIRSPGIGEEIRAEIAWLLEQTTVEQVRSELQASGDVVPSDLVGSFLDVVTTRPRSGLELFGLRRRLRRDLGAYRRHGRLRAGLGYVAGLWRQRRRFRRGPRARMTPAEGGVTIALVGADGAGKSTIADALVRWLGWKLDVRLHYMGSKDPSRRSRWLYLAFRALRRAHRSVSRRAGDASLPGRPLRAIRDLLFAIHCLSIGRDRGRRYLAAQRDAQAGRVVVFDRFPAEGLGVGPAARLLDGPRIARALDGTSGPVIRRLAEVEERSYAGFRPPDHVIVLEVSPDVALARKPDHDPDVLVAKGRAAAEVATVLERDGLGTTVRRVDADLPLEDVLRQVKAGVWDVL